MPSYCCVRGCRQKRADDYEDRRSFHRMPVAYSQLLDSWLAACRLKEADFKSCSKLRVCSRHFAAHDYVPGSNVKLEKDAIPSLLLPVIDQEPVAGRSSSEARRTPTASQPAPKKRKTEAAKKRVRAVLNKLVNDRRIVLPVNVFKQLEFIAQENNLTMINALAMLLDRYHSQPSRLSSTPPHEEDATPEHKGPATPQHEEVTPGVMMPGTPPSYLATPSSIVTFEPTENTDVWTPRHLFPSAADYDSEDSEYSDGQENVALMTPSADEDVEQESTPSPDSCWDKSGAMVCTSQLEELLDEVRLRCDVCYAPALHSVKRVSLSFCVTWTCRSCGGTKPRLIRRWWSSPRIGQQSELDVVFAGAIVMSGNHHQKVKRLFDLLNFGVISHNTYYRLAYHVVAPVIDEKYQTVTAENRDACMASAPDGLVAPGDCQNDSPGYSAAYGSDTAMDCDSSKILAQHMAVIDYDARMDRKVLQDNDANDGNHGNDGNERCVPVSSRAQGKVVPRPHRAPKRYSYVAEMLRKMVELRKDVAISGPRPMSADDPRRIHRHINPGTRPTPEGSKSSARPTSGFHEGTGSSCAF